MTSRRDFIKQATLLSGATTLAGFFPHAIHRAMAINPEPGSTYMDAEHIVILMQENRSFDHAYGKLKGVRGFNDPRAIELPNGNKVWLQSNKKGETYAPFRFDIKNSRVTWMSSLPHSWENMVDARNDGKHDDWLEAKKSGRKEYQHMPLTMGFHDREDIPFYYALADAFTVCDQHFCSCLTGTTANRHYLWTGTLRDPAYRKSKATVHNGDVTYNKWARWKTFPERLEEAGVSWKVYQNELSMPCGFEGEESAWLANFTNNNLEWFEQYGVRYAEGFQNYLTTVIEEFPGKIRDLERELATAQKGSDEYEELAKTLEESKSHLAQARENKEKWNRELFAELSEFEQNIHNKAFQTNSEYPDYHSIETLEYDDDGIRREMKVPKGDILYQFRKDVDEGNLPAVSWVCAPKNFSDHPGAPWYGAWYISEMMDILTKNPEVWKKTIFIVTYDENDGYFDHVPPFVPPETGNPESGRISHNIDTWQEFARKEDELERRKENPADARWGAVGLGFRVPMVVVSPWSRGGYVNSDVLDHTSTIQLIEKVMQKKTKVELREENISEWRRMICGDLSSAFRAYHGEKISFPDSVQRDEFVATIHKAQFKDLPQGYKNLTREEQQRINENPRNAPHMPRQEPGIKNSNALCYSMIVNGALDKESASFQLELANPDFAFGSRTRAVPFIVYATGEHLNAARTDYEKMRNWHYALAAGDRFEESFPISNFRSAGYQLRVYGPNGFFREFKGDREDPDLEIQYHPEQSKLDPTRLTGDLEITFHNKTNRNLGVLIEDQAYHSPPRRLIVEPGIQRTVLDLSGSHRWYDGKVTVEGFATYSQRFAGRVETGEEGMTDPQMG